MFKANYIALDDWELGTECHFSWSVPRFVLPRLRLPRVKRQAVQKFTDEPTRKQKCRLWSNCVLVYHERTTTDRLLKCSKAYKRSLDAANPAYALHTSLYYISQRYHINLFMWSIFPFWTGRPANQQWVSSRSCVTCHLAWQHLDSCSTIDVSVSHT